MYSESIKFSFLLHIFLHWTKVPLNKLLTTFGSKSPSESARRSQRPFRFRNIIVLTILSFFNLE